MLGLAVLFGLAVWVGFTFLIARCGYLIGKKFHYARTGAFLGFMLIMGGWFVYWAIEFAYLQVKVTNLCEKEAGVTVYITPEEWRKQLGEEEWNKIKAHNYIERQYYPNNNIIIDEIKYIPSGSLNGRLIEYSHFSNINNYIKKNQKKENSLDI